VIETSKFEDVTRIRMSLEADGKPVYWVAAYLVDGLLVDTGSSHTVDELVGFLEHEKLDLVVNTHYHEDHVGADRAIMERLGVPVFAHVDSLRFISEVAVLNPYQEFVWGYPEPVEVSTLGDFVETGKYRFDVVETGGHSEGHVALVEMQKGWCFSGDIFITERPKVIRADEDVAGLIDSMRQLIDLPTDRLVLFTSMGAVIPEGRVALESCLEYLYGMLAEVKALNREGLSPEEIRRRMLGEGSSLAAMTGGHFSSDNLIGSLLDIIDR
jgi:glyoxylase-like metal-dependent hydrolase (beta-lactamase superfamily II)